MRIAITSSHRPSPLVRRFVNRLASLLPADRVNRGKYSLDEMAAMLLDKGYTHLIVVDRKHGNSSRLRLYKLYKGKYCGYITLGGVRRLKPWFGKVDYVTVSGNSEALDMLKEFLFEFSSGRIGTLIEEHNNRIRFTIRGKAYGVQFLWKSVSREPEV